MPNDFLEKTPEDIVFENRAVIHTKGLCKFRGTSFRQVILPSGKKMDIISYDIRNGRDLNLRLFRVMNEILDRKIEELKQLLNK